MKTLIVNADDFGMTWGISEGIIQAHKAGIVTSTSLMVNFPGALHATKLAKQNPKLTVGLHGVLSLSGQKKESIDHYLSQLNSQLGRFKSLMGFSPSHFDLHGVPPTTKAMVFASYLFAKKHKLNYRGKSGENVIYDYFGMRKKRQIANLISLGNMINIINNKLVIGVNILVCHPGITSNRLPDPYRKLRISELNVLTNQKITDLLKLKRITLCNFRLEVIKK